MENNNNTAAMTYYADNADLNADVRILEDDEFDIKERVIYLIGDIESEEVVPTMWQFHFLTSEVRFPSTYKDEITLVLSSDGGFTDVMMLLYDAITTCKAPVVTIGTGHVCSAATLILACADRRYVTENCMVMTHSGTIQHEGNEDEVAAQQEMTAKMSHTYWHLLARHTKKSASTWRARAKATGEHWMGGEELVEWGVIDGIIKPTRKLRKIIKMSKKALAAVVHRVEYDEEEPDDADDC